mmetsp:Transcript_17776/g.49750  ORF Transcript_17776/g.49750 Transcript_17776/m.49750 type:complete len:116 (+) Transcript_17776:1603-1950(+)
MASTRWSGSDPASGGADRADWAMPAPIAAPRLYIKENLQEGIQAACRRDHREAQWWKRYIGNPPRHGSLAWGEFQFKFRVPWPLFNRLLDLSTTSGIFPDEMAREVGRQPAPLGL